MEKCHQVIVKKDIQCVRPCCK